jgi:nitroreductase
MPEIGLFEAIYSARSIRRLKPDPVPEELITKILDVATRAPSGGNAQNWSFVVVRDPDKRRRLGAIYRKASDIAEAIYAARGRPPHLTEQQYTRFMASGKYLWDHMGEAPVLLLPCSRRPVLPPPEALPADIATRWEDEAAYAERIRGASIYPAVQNIILACRALGLGTVITTNHIRCEDEVKSLLGIPEDVSTWALMPIGWPIGKFGPLTRRPLNEVAYADSWGTAWGGDRSARPPRRTLRALLAAALLGAAALGVLPSVAAEGITIELNRLEDQGPNCRAYLVIGNPGQAAFSGFKLDLVIFDRSGTIMRRLALDLAPLRAAKTGVKVFEIADTACAAIGRMLLNDVVDCRDAKGIVSDCIDRVSTSSKIAVSLMK